MLSKAFPKARRDLAKKELYKKRSKGEIAKFYDKPWRFCVFPYFEINAMTYCDENYLKISAERMTQCKHLHCINCCNHILLIFKYVVS